MLEQRYRWKNTQLRKQVSVLDGKESPTLLLKNAYYLNQWLRKWMKANIWIYEDRIVYVGEHLPPLLDHHCEVMDCAGFFLVPGYIEPHAHPFQLYNPLSLASYASKLGTTTLINDNLVLALHLNNTKAFDLMETFKTISATMYWWCRFDGQTELTNEETIFSDQNISSWLEHDAVLQGGELTGWPKLLDGNDLMLHWMQETKRMRKKVEGHFPGASEKTLAKMMLFGVDCDHEAMTGKDVLQRLLQGYTVSLRYSSIRPDLPDLLEGIHKLGIHSYDQFIYTTDGSSATFYEQGMIDHMIRIAIENEVPVVDAYNMGTINPARYYHLDYLHGQIATGRIANINFLEDQKNPTPISVLSKGNWLKRENQLIEEAFPSLNWREFDLDPLQIEWELTIDDLQFSMLFGIEMENGVITKPYSVTIDVSRENLSYEHDECFFMLIDKHGKWRLNTILKGFANRLDGFASSYSNTGDIILIGKNKHEMIRAFHRIKEMGGGIALADSGQIITEIPLSLKGIMANLTIEELIKCEKQLLIHLRDKGYRFEDPIYTLLFFSSTHLPYIRITQRGMYDVMNKMVLFPTIMR
ncbi:adenine deaminase C-terminal domain-containing protein [Bacillus sp. 03113]|uniref:adenine deaminase C-terminal domain-containing protein n=1 Tax=Bacillus sp. 03113 TaxID=2578211 RepID=UPI00114154BB|nr:adenine deaminase C-terminal domain-containing protein [Bacillus sp. 03113]